MLVLPGLTGCSKDNYVSHFVDKAKKFGCKAVVMNYRGIEVDLLTPKTYSATNLEDLHLVVEHIKERMPKDKLFAIGISLGGIKLGCYLAKQYDNCSISYAMVVSAPFNLLTSANELEKSTNLFFNKILANNISKYCIK
jgi:abhydrolase domain-containing protein 1/3